MAKLQTRLLSERAAQAERQARRELLELAAHHAEYVGWMLQERGDERGALSWTARAVSLEARTGRHLALATDNG